MLSAFCLLAYVSIAAAAPPNILLITCDNLGYGDLQIYNPDSEIRTPCLTKLAAQGAKLNSFYTASPTCTVSRASLLTGRIPQRHGLTKQLPGVKGNYGPGLDSKERLIPELLKLAPTPYVSGCFGKWNIGFAPGSRPTERGFDEFIGHASGNMDYYRHNYRERHDLYQGVVPLRREGEYATDLFADAAIDFIRRHTKTKTPWFCYLPFNAPHFPTAGNKRPGEPNTWQAPDEAFQSLGLEPSESDPRKRYSAVVHWLDRAIGRVLASLDEQQVADSTFVFFMSDNGAFRLNRRGLDVGINTPLRSGGVTCWEGGLRVPAIARWPKQIPAGSVVEQPLWSPDLLLACVRLGSCNVPAGIVLDGVDPLPLLMQEASRVPQRDFFFRYGRHAAYRSGNWKIVRERNEQPWMLFDLSRDVGETEDLADSRPETLKALVAAFNNQDAELQRGRAKE